ncbi:hypothetical protein [Stutzerimonas urumqiensis]|uniref:hypothetical protein n=1 Tax=Stutzerimonas urumqiensis TaxID=638269 RepID=UPI000EAE1619|nr:hypothetical protein [Stutzerimonas urumqiensis]
MSADAQQVQSLMSAAWERGNHLMSAGYGLMVIGDLLGADGSEHSLGPGDLSGLQHAVVALGAMVLDAGQSLTERAELAGYTPINS